MVLALVLLPGIGVTLEVRGVLTRAMTVQLREQSVSIARDVAARSTDLILINDLYGVTRLLRETQANNPDVRYAFVLDPGGHVLAHTFGQGFPIALIAANIAGPNEHHHTLRLATNEGPIWDTAVPIFDGKVGIARVGLSEARMQATVNAVTLQLLLTTGMVTIVGIAAAIFLTWLLTRPVLALVHATEAMRQGNFDQRVSRWADDEIGELADAFNMMAADLAQAEAERVERERMRAYYLRQIISAQEEERKRIARELHDETGQALASLMVGLRNVEDAPTPNEMQERLADMRTLAANTLEAVRNLALELRPSVLDDLGLTAALRRYAQRYQERFGTPVEVQAAGLASLRLVPEVETTIYRIVQEALTNAARHAACAHISVLLQAREGQLSVIVEDDGCGFDVQHVFKEEAGRSKLGLYGMQERAELIGGRLDIESQPGVGTAIYLRVPLDDMERQT